MKKVLLVSGLKKVGVSALVVAPMFASAFLMMSPVSAATISTTPASHTSTNSSSANLQTRLANIKSRADKEIDRRITSMKALITKVNGTAKLTQTQKDTLSATLQTNISNLSALQVKVDGDTDLATLKVDIKSIVDQYRIFAVLEPQINVMKTSDVIDANIAKFSTIAPKLNALITAAQTKEQNVTALQVAYTDMMAKITDATTQSNSAYTSVSSLTPANYPITTTLKSARASLQTSIQDLKAARLDVKTIRDGLKALNPTPASKTTTTPSVVPTTKVQ